MIENMCEEELQNCPAQDVCSSALPVVMRWDGLMLHKCYYKSLVIYTVIDS